MHAIINRPVVRLDKIVARPMMYIVLTYDHRLIDGREAGIIKHKKHISHIFKTFSKLNRRPNKTPPRNLIKY
jgi:pyruvate/2-oxoglutarate dehydrogenase complex dihydrolipoamide acyltransferase (E2) component